MEEQPVIWVILTAMCACLAIGYLIGWLVASDRHEATEHPLPTAVGAHAQPQPLRLVLRRPEPDTGDLIAINAAETARFPGLDAQPALGALVRAPGHDRAADFIARMRADTDRWIAAHAEGAR